MFIKSRRIKESAFQYASVYLTKKAGKDVCNKPQIEALAWRALENLKTHNPGYYKKIHSHFKYKNFRGFEKSLEAVLISSKTPWKPQLQQLTVHQTLILELIQGNNSSAHKIVKDKKLISALLFKQNAALMLEARQLIQKLFWDIEKQLEDSEYNPTDSFHLEMMIGDLLALYPYFRPDGNESLIVPVLKNGIWNMVDYTVEKIHLTPSWMGSPITAYGLTAQDAPPQLLFKGTTYPSDKGFGLSLLTDINPIHSVGDFAFRLGKKKIGQWLRQHAKKHKAIITGKSLGGAKAWKTSLYFPQHIEKVMAYGAPGYSLMDLQRLKKLRQKKLLPKINIFFQKDDPVTSVDMVASLGVNYYQVVGTNLQKGVLAHASMYAMHENSIIVNLDASKEAVRIKRIAMTILRGTISFIFFPFFATAYACYAAVRRLFK